MAEEITDIIVLIPGIGGSVLERNGKEIWAPRLGAFWRGLISRGSSIKDLALDGDDPDALALGDGIEATELIPDLHIVPGLDWKIDGYTQIRRSLVRGLGLVPGENYFELPYDWRRDNRVAAAKLAARAERWLARRRQQGFPDAQLILVGHSMGGIVARIYLETMEGWRDTRGLVTFGTPFLGSIKALEFLANGFTKDLGPITIDLTETIRSMTAVYQLLPSYRCMETGVGDPVFVDEVGAIPGLTGATEASAVADALALQRSIRAAVDAHRATDYEATGCYDLRPVVGNRQRTLTSARVENGSIATSRLRGGIVEGGDGTVPSISSSPHEILDQQQNVMFCNTKHASIQNTPGVIEHVMGIATALNERRTVPVLPAEPGFIELDIDDVLVGETVRVNARTSGGGGNPAFRFEQLGTGTSAGAPLTGDTSGRLTASLADLPAGEYRGSIVGPGLAPVEEIFAVIDPTDG